MQLERLPEIGEVAPAINLGNLPPVLQTRYVPGRRGWRKLRSRSTSEAIAAGVTGRLTDPATVLLGRLDATGRLRYVGRTRTLNRQQRHELAQILRTIGMLDPGEDHPWPPELPATWSGQFGGTGRLIYHQITPVLVAEIGVDAAYEYGRWRHPPGFVRIRADSA